MSLRKTKIRWHGLPPCLCEFIQTLYKLLFEPFCSFSLLHKMSSDDVQVVWQDCKDVQSWDARPWREKLAFQYSEEDACCRRASTYDIYKDKKQVLSTCGRLLCHCQPPQHCSVLWAQDENRDRVFPILAAYLAQQMCSQPTMSPTICLYP